MLWAVATGIVLRNVDVLKGHSLAQRGHGHGRKIGLDQLLGFDGDLGNVESGRVFGELDHEVARVDGANRDARQIAAQGPQSVLDHIGVGFHRRFAEITNDDRLGHARIVADRSVARQIETEEERAGHLPDFVHVVGAVRIVGGKGLDTCRDRQHLNLGCIVSECEGGQSIPLAVVVLRHLGRQAQTLHFIGEIACVDIGVGRVAVVIHAVVAGPGCHEIAVVVHGQRMARVGRLVFRILLVHENRIQIDRGDHGVGR
jgi:hypothetical protein